MSHGPGRSAAAERNELTLEEHLQRAEQRFALLSDVFEFYSVAADAGTAGLSSAGATALHRDCRALAHELRHVLTALPAETLNVVPRRERLRRSRRRP